MKVQTLKTKLNKSGVSFKESKGDISFTIKKKKYTADTNNSDTILCFFYVRGYDVASQETDRRFFDNFAQVLRHSIR